MPRHLLAQPLLQRRPPWHELETKTIVDHGEPPRRKRDALAVDARHMLAFGRWLMAEPRLIPKVIAADRHAAQSRIPMDVMVSGLAMSFRHAAHAASMMAS